MTFWLLLSAIRSDSPEEWVMMENRSLNVSMERASFTREASFHYVILVDLILSSLDLSNQTRFGFLVLQVNAHVIMLLASALWNILVTSILLWKLMGYTIFRITPAMFTCSMTLNLINLSSSEINKIWLYLCQTPTE